MLTKDLLMFTQRMGKIRPRFVKTKEEELQTVAEDLVQIAKDGVGEPMKELEEALGCRVNGYKRPPVARGLAKLVLDRVEVEAPDEAAGALRERAFDVSMDALAAVSDDETFEAYERRLQDALQTPLLQVRHELYADLPSRRGALSFKELTGMELLERYNLALAQGLVMYAHRVSVIAEAPDLVVVRRLLRWLKFCRLVCGVKREGSVLQIDVEGPATVLGSSRKYGLQLANFLMAVPLLKRYEVQAEVQLPRRPKATLRLDHKDPLISTLKGGLGHIPPELELVARSFDDSEWTLDTLPSLRSMGVSGACVPDFSLKHKASDLVVSVELFHGWHKGMLDRRILELQHRPDPHFLLGVERSLAKKPEVKAQLEALPQVFLFSSFPTTRVLQKALKPLVGS